MINRKNHGTVTMTSQRATGNTRTLGMTTDDGTIERYLRTANPGRPSTDSHIGAVEKPRSVTLRDGRYQKIKLFIERGCYYFLRETRFTQLAERSITYNNKERALAVHAAGTIRWRSETHPIDPSTFSQYEPR
jgi:hypothetical protein